MKDENIIGFFIIIIRPLLLGGAFGLINGLMVYSMLFMFPQSLQNSGASYIPSSAYWLAQNSSLIGLAVGLGTGIFICSLYYYITFKTGQVPL
jgi:hypothetical protein